MEKIKYGIWFITMDCSSNDEEGIADFIENEIL